MPTALREDSEDKQLQWNLVERRIRPKYSFKCQPTQYARRRTISPTMVVVWMITSLRPRQYVPLSENSHFLDANLLSRHNVLLVYAHAEKQGEVQSTRNILVDALNLSRPATCAAEPALPNDYSCALTPRGNPVVLLVRRMPLPSWVGSMKDAARMRGPESCNGANVEYSLGTMMYTYPLLHDTEVVDYFDYFAKVDLDVRVYRKDAQSIMHRMVAEGAHFMHTALQPEGDLISCTYTQGAALLAYLRSAQCHELGWPSEKLLTDPPIYYSNFMAGWLGLFQSPQVLEFAQLWWSWPAGLRYRWGDQQFWTHALWVGGSSNKVLDLTHWRWEWREAYHEPAVFSHKQHRNDSTTARDEPAESSHKHAHTTTHRNDTTARDEPAVS